MLSILGLILLGAGAIAGGVIGGVSAWGKDQKAVEDAQFKQNQLQESYKDATDLAFLEFETNKKEANRKADVMDKQSTLNEGYVSDALNNQLAGLSLQEEMETWQFNQEAIAAGQTEGNDLAAMAQSGVKNSTMDDAVKMQASMNSQQLQLQEDMSRADDKIKLGNLFNDLSQNVNNIQLNRNDAAWIRDNYNPGGGAYEIFQQQGKNRKNEFNRNWNTLQRGIDDINSQMGWDITAGILSGTAKGAMTGYKIQNFLTDIASPKSSFGSSGNNTSVSWG